MRTSPQHNALAIIVAIIVVLCVGVAYYRATVPQATPTPPPPASSTNTADDPSTKAYIGSGFSFHYPTTLYATQATDTVTLAHSIPYKHANPCDFKGDGPALDAVTDFNLSIKIVPKGVEEYLTSAGWPDWEYVSKNPYTEGAWSGYHVTPGVEGCGEDLYFLTVSPNKTVVITRPMVGEFAPVNGNAAKYLALPGIIAPTTSDAYFSHILSSLRVN